MECLRSPPIAGFLRVVSGFSDVRRPRLCRHWAGARNLCHSVDRRLQRSWLVGRQRIPRIELPCASHAARRAQAEQIKQPVDSLAMQRVTGPALAARALK
jgi:hypothetical protein